MDSPQEKPKAGFWKRQFLGEPTGKQVVFDVLFGLLLPVICLIFDPIVLSRWLPGDSSGEPALLEEYHQSAYAGIAFQLLALAGWLCCRRRLARLGPFLGGIFLSGAALALAIGAWISPQSFFGLLFFFIGALGFSPFFAALVFARNGIRAIAAAGKGFPGLQVFSGAFLIVLILILAPTFIPPFSVEGLWMLGTKLDSVSVAFSPDGGILLSGGADGALRIWDVKSGGLEKTVAAHPESIAAVGFSPDSRRAATAGRDGAVKLWSAPGWELEKVFFAHPVGVNALRFSPDGRTIATGGGDGAVRLWSVPEGSLLRALEAHGGEVNAVAFSSNGQLLSSGGDDRTVRVWNVQTWESLWTLSGHAHAVTALAFSPDGRQLASGSGGFGLRDADPTGEVFLWDVENGALAEKLDPVGDGYIISLIYSPAGRPLVAGIWGYGGRRRYITLDLHFWKLERSVWSESRNLPYHHYPHGPALAFSPDGRLLAAGASEKEVQLLDPQAKEVKQTLQVKP
ncbi:MAG: WD40 repeat domain-containing protein [Planctomycetes bacterium]|nr:WD40 repeat domain-containing protein [Planctomycetota bacterium]